jgi:phosphinothricin acetyltransferase
MSITIRRATADDVPAMLEIYNHFVVQTPVTFDIEPRTLEQRLEWFAQFKPGGRHQCFVAEDGGRVVGYAGSQRFKERAAYDTTIEMTIYCAHDRGGQGIGGKMYAALFDALKGEDIHRAYGGITLPNAASVALHQRFGFRHIGSYDQVGRKFGKYWDVGHYLKEM